MENSNNSENGDAHKTEFKRFAFKRIIVVSLFAVAAIWIISVFLGYFEKPAEVQVAHKTERRVEPVPSTTKVETEPLPKASEEEMAKTAETEQPYEKDTAGDIMTSDFIALDKELTTGEAVEYLKKIHHDLRQPFHLFVVDAHEKLLGTVSLKQLMFESTNARLEDFMTADVMSANTGMDKADVRKIFDRNQLQTLPVVDHTGRLVGVIKAEQVTHMAQKETGHNVTHAPEPSHEAATKTAVPAPEPSQKVAEKKSAHPLPAPREETAASGHAAPTHEVAGGMEVQPRPKGVAFVEATIKPLDFELRERFWGWRPNDILDFTDNVNNFQLGVLEVTRRTVVALTERISRTGATASFDKNLENAMNWFMVKPDRYWFPSPESKYKAGLDELRTYKEKLERGEANFHTRPDNLIPLLMAYEDLLGSCEENLVKTKEDDGTPVSFFKSDDYFFYAQGVASAMGTILEAIQEDFLITVESRRGAEVLHNAIESCHHAAGIKPWLITNSNLSGILANHRANLAAPMSHARFYISVLIKTLST